MADVGTKKNTLLYKEKLRRIDLLDWLKGTFTETQCKPLMFGKAQVQ